MFPDLFILYHISLIRHHCTMKLHAILSIPLLMCSGAVSAQHTFKAGWKTYNTGTIIHEYSYRCDYTDTVRLFVTDSMRTYIAADSAVVLTEAVRGHDKNVYKTIYYFNPGRQLIKQEDYKNDNLLERNEWRYDDKKRISSHIRNSSTNGNVYKKLFTYSTDKGSGESVEQECAYFNGKVEFYTKKYYDKKNVMYKEVRLNDNNKDIVHVENFTYGENGKVKQRSVYFPQFKVTKTFDEPAGMIPAKCFGLRPMGSIDKGPSARIPFILRVMAKHKVMLQDTSCKDYEYTFSNNTNCFITISSGKEPGTRMVRYRLKEKV